MASVGARDFIHLSLFRQYATVACNTRTTFATPLLDVLLPTQTRCFRPDKYRRSFSNGLAAPSSNFPTHHPKLATSLSGQKGFSTTPTQQATQALYNPQKDDDNKEMMMEITPRAAKRLAEIMAKDSNSSLALRIQVESGGCHGFQYLMSLVTLPPALPSPQDLAAQAESAESEGHDDYDAPIRADDTIFSFVADEHPVVAAAAGSADYLAVPKIIMDRPSLELLNGSKVDFTMELIGSQFKVVDSPNATSSCGCGTSFDIKI